AWPERLQTNVPALDLFEYSQLNFQAPDTQKFPALNLARQAMRAGGLAPTILNAANEIAVEAFLMERIGFTSIPQVVEHTLEKLENAAAESIECILDKDKVARSVAKQYISSIGG
ncbi:1-deoxy-D-xylulose-5-phosphate reductoisomerase, partial [Klebsiella pneumoniae]|nr:1-deoxy-D-xylulose-5-phosphate reductoisomerase [Klebsiella pneumoniae]